MFRTLKSCLWSSPKLFCIPKVKFDFQSMDWEFRSLCHTKKQMLCHFLFNLKQKYWMVLRVRNICKMCSHKETCQQRKLRQTISYLWKIKLTRTPVLPNCQVPNGFFWFYKCKFYHSKIETLTLSLSQFSLVFLREREKIFYTYSVPSINLVQSINYS